MERRPGGAESEKVSSSAPPAELKSVNVQFRARKRSRNAHSKRKRHRAEEEDVDGQEIKEEDGTSRSELLMMRKAQILRERSRRVAMDIAIAAGPPTQDESGEEKGVLNDVIGELKNQFAVEKSGHVSEERMRNYVEEGMRRKFGDGQTEGVNDSGHGSQRDLYSIPERLRVEEGPLYDPGEGMPAGGVEEVEVSQEMKRQTEVATKKARAELVMRAAKQKREDRVVSGARNISADYVKHKRDWLDEHCGNDAPNTDVEAAAEGGSGEGSKGDRNRRRYATASDAMVAERFRKRWRR